MTEVVKTRGERLARRGLTALTIPAAGLLFTHLGHDAPWDDEAITALHAEGIWRTGDTTAILDHNVVAYRSGDTLRDFR